MTKKVFNLAGGKHSDAAYAAFENRLLSSVKASLDSFVVSAGTGMQVNISAGDGLISTGSGNARRIQSDAVENATVSAASASFNRRDTVVAYIDTGVTPSTGVVDNSNDVLKFAVVAGTAAATPAAPSDATIQAAIGAGNPFLRLAEILVPQSAVNLSGATFTDIAALPPQVSGWRSITDAWAYSSWSSTTRTGVITVPSDATLRYSAGMRIRIRQSTGGTKYGVIVAVSSTTLTVFFQSGTTLNNETIYYPAYSGQKAPLGFNTDRNQWALYVTDTTNRIVSASTYTTMTVNLPVGIGVWELAYRLDIRVTNGSGSAKRGFITLSSDGSTETDPELTCTMYVPATSGFVGSGTCVATKTVAFTSAKTLLFLGRVSSTPTDVQMDNGTTQAMHLWARCAYV